MATRAVYSFSGFTDQPPLHLDLHHDGYPAGAAWRFAEALRQRGAGESFLAAFLRSQPEVVALNSVAEAADADYHYHLRLLQPAGMAAAPATAIAVHCWRRLPAGGWHPRCTPLSLDAFIQRFLLAAAADISAATPDDEPSGTPPAHG